MTVESLVDAGSWETSFWPTSGWEMSTPVNQVRAEFDPGVEDREVPNTWLEETLEYSAPREAPRPLVAPTIRMFLDIVVDLDVE